MNWENLILKTNPSLEVKNIINNINNINDKSKFNGKYIGIIPLYWNGLGIYQQNKKNKIQIELDNQNQTLQNIQNIQNISDNINELQLDEIVKNIYTDKKNLLLEREFYYITKKNIKTPNNDNNEEAFYPVYKFPNNIPFTLRNIQEYAIKQLELEGIRINNSDIFRIYKMSGFHLFVILSSNRIKMNLNLEHIVPNIEWKNNNGIELLSINDKEIINSFMKISNDKFINNSYGKNWLQKLNGYNYDTDCIFPFQINWVEIIATLANFIDNEPRDNLHLYFKPHIIQDKNNMIDIFNDLHKKKLKISEEDDK